MPAVWGIYLMALLLPYTKLIVEEGILTRFSGVVCMEEAAEEDRPRERSRQTGWLRSSRTDRQRR